MDDDAAVERARVRGRPSLGSCALAGWWSPRPRRRSCSNKAILRRDGVSYLIETIHFNSTSRKSPCSRTDDFDIASLAFSSLAAAVLNGHMDDFRVVADGLGGRRGSLLCRLPRPEGEPHQNRRGPLGNTLALSGIGGAADMGIRALLRRHGLEDKRDYIVVEVQFPSMRVTLEVIGPSRRGLTATLSGLCCVKT